MSTSTAVAEGAPDSTTGAGNAGGPSATAVAVADVHEAPAAPSGREITTGIADGAAAAGPGHAHPPWSDGIRDPTGTDEEGDSSEGSDGSDDAGTNDAPEQFAAELATTQYATLGDLNAALRAFAADNGFAIVVRSSSPRYLLYICDRGRPYDDRRDLTDATRQRHTSSRMCGCAVKILCRLGLDGQWTAVSTGANAVHNHGRSVHMTAHPSLRRLLPEVYDQVASLRSSGLTPGGILRALKHERPDSLITLQDVSNAVKRQRRLFMDDRTSAQAMLAELNRPELNAYCQYKEGSDHALTHFFISTKATIKLLHQYCDVLLLDCTYKTNAYDMPMLEVVGITALGESFTAAAILMP